MNANQSDKFAYLGLQFVANGLLIEVQLCEVEYVGANLGRVFFLKESNFKKL